MGRFLFACLLVFASLQSAAAPARAGLPPAVGRALAVAGIPSTAVAVVVQDADAPAPLLAVNADQAMNPASVMKLVTTYAALDLLGPAATWKTEALASAPIVDGVLAGDLYLRGGGDPKLTVERFWLLLRQLRAQGLREIRGDLVLDRGAFAPLPPAPPFDDQPLRAYNVAPDALLVNFDAVALNLRPDPERRAVAVDGDLLPDNLEVVSQLVLGNGDCGDWRAALSPSLVPSGPGYRLLLTGRYAAACGERVLNLGGIPADRYLLGLFRRLWREMGGAFSGGVRDGAVPAEARRLAWSESPTVAEVIRDINKFSNNVMARQLFLSLPQVSGATPEQAAQAVQRWLAGKGLAFPELVLDNGAGLSRRERISAASLSRLLQDAWRSPLMPELVSSLPLAAVDGTLRSRLGETAVAGRGHFKTGTLDGAKTLAGYLQDDRGRTVIVVFLVNHANAARAQAAQDALLQWAYGAGR